MTQPDEPIPYARHEITTADEAAVLGVLRSKWLTHGPKVEEFESALASLCDAKYAICTNSGASALYATWRSVGTDELVTTPVYIVAIGVGIAEGAAPGIELMAHWRSSTTRFTVAAMYSTSASTSVGNIGIDSVEAAKVSALGNGASAG